MYVCKRLATCPCVFIAFKICTLSYVLWCWEAPFCEFPLITTRCRLCSTCEFYVYRKESLPFKISSSPPETAPQGTGCTCDSREKEARPGLFSIKGNQPASDLVIAIHKKTRVIILHSCSFPFLSLSGDPCLSQPRG